MIMRKKNDTSDKKIMRSFFLDKKQLERLNRLSATTRVPMAVYIRDGLELVLNKHEKKLRNKSMRL
jgi:predicted DNA-binding protein